MGKKIIIIVLIILCIVLFGCSKEQMHLHTIINNVQQLGMNFESFSAELVGSSINNEGELGEEHYYTFYYSKGRYLIEWVDEYDRIEGNLFDGKDLWHYTKGEREVTVSRNAQKHDQFFYLRDFGKDFDNLEYLGTEEVEDYKTHVIAGTKTFESGVTQEVTWWIDEETWFPFISENTIVGVTAIGVYRNFAINPSLDNSLFVFVPPDDAIIYERPNDPSLPPK